MSSNDTPNFKTNSLGKKRTSLTTRSPIPQPSYSQHVTPKHSAGIAGAAHLIAPHLDSTDKQPSVYHHGHHMSMVPKETEKPIAYLHKRSTSEGINDILGAHGAYPAAPISGSKHGLRVIKRSSVGSKQPSHSSVASEEILDGPVGHFKNIQDHISHFAQLRAKGA